MCQFTLSSINTRNREDSRRGRIVNAEFEQPEQRSGRQRQFVSDAAHELRTPLTALRVRIEEALMYPEDIDPQTIFEQALHETERLQAVVEDLLLLARLGTASAICHEPINLSSMISAQTRHRNTKHMLTHLEQGVHVRGIPAQLNRLVAALLDNAERHADSTIKVELLHSNERAWLTVTDDGPGIPIPSREHVFERFSRLDSARSRDTGGKGLGLAIARGIAITHDGSLTVEDSPCGARFVLQIPLLQADST
ncbi:MAG: hypothetical protein JWN52_6593 [Actinomycetia bacterium]|nr:hypothetical protein [Actinomycetes bacterium]